jgi:hypothetical protein
MTANEIYSGTRWDSGKELPSGDEVLHVWKAIIPLSDTAGLYKESDGFRKKLDDSLFYQLNIESLIGGDTQAIRTGILFFYHRNLSSALSLDDTQIDSIANNWGLIYLIRNR